MMTPPSRAFSFNYRRHLFHKLAQQASHARARATLLRRQVAHFYDITSRCRATFASQADTAERHDSISAMRTATARPAQAVVAPLKEWAAI